MQNHNNPPKFIHYMMIGHMCWFVPMGFHLGLWPLSVLGLCITNIAIKKVVE